MSALAACVEKAGRQAVINGTLQSTRHSGAQRKQWWSPLNRGEARSICRQSRAAAPASSRSARLSSPESCGHMLGFAANSQEVNFLTKHRDKYDIQTSCVQPGWTRMPCQAQAAHVSHLGTEFISMLPRSLFALFCRKTDNRWYIFSKAVLTTELQTQPHYLHSKKKHKDLWLVTLFWS